MSCLVFQGCVSCQRHSNFKSCIIVVFLHPCQCLGVEVTCSFCFVKSAFKSSCFIILFLVLYRKFVQIFLFHLKRSEFVWWLHLLLFICNLIDETLSWPHFFHHIDTTILHKCYAYIIIFSKSYLMFCTLIPWHSWQRASIIVEHCVNSGGIRSIGDWAVVWNWSHHVLHLWTSFPSAVWRWTAFSE